MSRHLRRTCFLLPLFLLQMTLSAFASGIPKILVINSYNPEYRWTENQYSGITGALEQLGTEYTVYTEYLDWKRFPDEQHIALLHAIFKEKYPSKGIDLIITTDDRALEFAIENRKELFSNAPIVFAGVYRESAVAMTAGQTGITGVYEAVDIDNTLRYALKINPAIDRAYLINEQTESGKETENLMIEALNKIIPGISIHSLSDLSLEEIERLVPSLDKKSLLLLGSYSIEKNGGTYAVETLAHRISNASAVPLFILFSHVFGTGAIGGSLLNGRIHGAIAGRIALRILRGANVNSIPPVPQDVFTATFDYNVLNRFNIPFKVLPKNADILNQNPPFFIHYKMETAFICVIFLFLLAFIYLLASRNRQNRRLAYSDQLTGLPNRLAVFQTAEKILSETETGKKCGVFFIDIDNFKNINDTFGHDTGDKVLVWTTQILQTLADENIKLAHFGGDEFLAFLSNASNTSIEAFAEKIHSLLGEKTAIGNKELYLTASTGIAVYPDHGSNFQELYQSADAAMNRAKAAGKNRFMFFTESMLHELERRMKLEHGLHSAIENRELFVMYQPQINLATGRLDGLEALVRWQNPQEGLISPAEFIPIAEESGQIDAIGLFVLRSAAQFIKQAEKAGFSDFSVSVNVSVKQLHHTNFFLQISDIVESECIPVNRLSLEITESILIESVEESRTTLEILKKAGFRISLDDFGKGYSSLSYLRKLPINYVKIDKGFIDDMFEDEKSRNLTRSIIGLCHELGLKVVAEGVETKEQMQFLQDNRCDLIQGYYFSKPEFTDTIKGLLNHNFLGFS